MILFIKFKTLLKKYVKISRLWHTFLFVLYCFLTVVLFGSIFILIFECFGNIDIIHGFSKNNLINDYGLKSPFLKSTYILLAAPIAEEIIFRLHLKEFEKNFYISFLLLVLYSIIPFFYENFLLYFFGAYGLFLIILLRLYKRKKILSKHIFKFNFYVSIVFFGLGHLGQIENFTTEIWPFLFLFIGILLIVGYFLSRIRIKIGIAYSIIAHFLFNLHALPNIFP